MSSPKREKPKPGHFRAAPRWIRVAPLFLLLAAPLVGACRPAGQSPAAAGAEAQPLGEEFWEAFFLQGAKIGYGHTTVREIQRNGRPLLDTRSTNHLEIARFGQRTTQDLEMQLIETPAGEVLEFTTEVAFGPSPSIVSGRVEGSRMTITTRTQGRSDTTEIAWSSDIRGFRAVEQSLERAPMTPGERRSFKMLVPLVNQIAEVELVAKDYETTPVLGVEARLLRVDSVARLPGGQSIQSTLWIDAQGRAIKTRVAALDQESFRTTRELARAPARGKAFDIGLNLIVKVDPPLPNSRSTRKVVYRVELTDADPAKTFATGPTQQVRSLGPHAAEVTVTSLKPADVHAPDMPPPAPSAEYTAANSILQIDDPRIRAMAREARGTITDSRQLALALEGFVHRAVSEKNFSHGFATAAEVAASREGDCTEHAVLLAALARACGLPSRVAIGLVYVEPEGGFGYHMWTEVYVDGVWVPLDAIAGQGGTSAAYLKLADSSLEGATAYSSFLAVAQVLGQLKISVIEAE